MPARFQPRLQYEHPGLGDDSAPDPLKAVKMATAKWVAEIIEHHYPGHAWHVVVNITAHKGGRPTGGLIQIRLNGLMPPNHWYSIQLADTLCVGGRQRVMKGAGELLERYNIPRTGFMLDHWRAALAAIPLDRRRLGRGHLAPLL